MTKGKIILSLAVLIALVFTTVWAIGSVSASATSIVPNIHQDLENWTLNGEQLVTSRCGTSNQYYISDADRCYSKVKIVDHDSFTLLGDGIDSGSGNHEVILNYNDDFEATDMYVYNDVSATNAAFIYVYRPDGLAQINITPGSTKKINIPASDELAIRVSGRNKQLHFSFLEGVAEPKPPSKIPREIVTAPEDYTLHQTAITGDTSSDPSIDRETEMPEMDGPDIGSRERFETSEEAFREAISSKSPKTPDRMPEEYRDNRIHTYLVSETNPASSSSISFAFDAEFQKNPGKMDIKAKCKTTHPSTGQVTYKDILSGAGYARLVSGEYIISFERDWPGWYVPGSLVPGAVGKCDEIKVIASAPKMLGSPMEFGYKPIAQWLTYEGASYNDFEAAGYNVSGIAVVDTPALPE
ncbi:hypothetical protein ACFL2B_02590 [Patescibacteria group bacterium]